MNRRFFLLAAPAIVAAPSLMRVSAKALDALPSLNDLMWSDAAAPWGVGKIAGFDVVTLTAEATSDHIYFINPARYGYTINGKTITWADATAEDRAQGIIRRIA